jgi:hypothetical protein
MIWSNDAITEQSTCPVCALGNDETPRVGGYGRGRGRDFPSRGRPNRR